MQAPVVNAVRSSRTEGETGLLFNVLAEFDPGDGLDSAVGGEGRVAREAEAEGGELGADVSVVC